jgi:hypothetical protein
MKMINCNSWAPRNVDWASHYEWSGPVPITSPPILSDDNLYYSFYAYRTGGPAKFYYLLICPLTYTDY